jgi:hypothetical protein
MTPRLLLSPIAFALCAASCSCTWLDHTAGVEIERDVSEQGWAIARVLYADQGRRLELRYFSGRTKAVSLPCCTRAELEAVTRGRIALVDLTGTPDPSSPELRRDPRQSGFGGPVVVMDTEGTVIERSEVSVHADLLSLSPDGKSFAYVGVRPGHPADKFGVYVAEFRGQEARRLTEAEAPPRDQLRRPWSLDWSPDGRDLLFASADESIQIIDVQSGASQGIAEGGVARWSSAGGWITYITPRNEAMLFNLTTRETKAIDPGKEVIAPVEWSPDGKYLLILEGKGSHVPYGCYWVYRISDSSWFPLRDLGVGGFEPNWIKLEGDPTP